MAKRAFGVAVSVVLFMSIGGPGQLRAEPPASGEMSVQQAYEKGAEEFDAENYEKAAEYFRYAVEQKPHPVLRFNLAQAYARTGNWKKSLEHARKADRSGKLDEKTSASNHGTLAAGRVALTAMSVDPRSRPESGVDTKTDTGGSGGPFTVLGWSGVGAAAGGIGLMTGSIFVANSLDEDFAAREAAIAEGDVDRANSLGSKIRSTQRTGKILRYGGLVLATVGVGLVVTDLAIQGQSLGMAANEPTVAPAVGTGRAGFRIAF